MMWQRFTERARRIVFFAQEEAGRLGENYVSTEHLLLGLAREDDTVAARILSVALGVSLASVRAEIERQVMQGQGREKTDMQLTPRAKRVIDLAYDEARQLNNNYIGTEHLLLGLIREGEGLAGRVLEKLGVTLDATRAAVVILQKENPANEKDNPTPGAEGLQEMAERQSRPLTDLISAAMKELTTGEFRPGDMGETKHIEGKTFVEVAMNETAYIALRNAYEAKDRYGYEELKADGSLLFLPSGVALKRLSTPVIGRLAAAQGGIYIRVLSGEHEGKAGWLSPDSCERTGSDNEPFPME